MDFVIDIFKKIKERKIDFAEAEYILRPYFENLPDEEYQNKYEQAYDYLDVLVGTIDGRDQIDFQQDIEGFYKFLEKIDL